MPAEEAPKKDFHVEQLVQEHGKDINDLGGKLGKCYSSERYEEFQEAVEKIVLKTIEGGKGEEKIKEHAKDYFTGKVIGVALIWLITLIATGLLQRYFKIFGG